MSGQPSPEAEATRRLDRTMAAAVGASRALVLTQTLAITLTLRRRVPRPRPLLAGVAAIVGQSAWAALRSRRRGSIRDRGMALSDGAVQCLALVTEAASWGTRALPEDPRWSETFGAVVTSWLAFEDPALPVHGGSLLAWIATYLATTSSRSASGTLMARGQRVNEVAGHIAFSGVGRQLGRQLIDQAAELDAARAEAMAQAERLATELERDRQRRIIHDSALQVLEAVAGGWDIDSELLRRRIHYETSRLRRLLDSASGSTRSLQDELEALVEAFALAGLRVELDSAALSAPVSQRGIDALTEAAHEALTNVHKHAGVDTATVRAMSDHRGAEIRVIDCGRGFDPGRSRRGFGLTESIEGRLRDAGGRAAVSSTAGAGTDVRLWVPS